MKRLRIVKVRTSRTAEEKRLHTMDIILVIVGIALLLFTVGMILLFICCGSIPDTLVTCVFAVLGTECGVMGWIKTAKEKYSDNDKKKEEDEYAAK